MVHSFQWSHIKEHQKNIHLLFECHVSEDKDFLTVQEHTIIHCEGLRLCNNKICLSLNKYNKQHLFYFFGLSCPILNSCRPKSVNWQTHLESTKQLLDLKLPCETMSLSCKYIIPFKISLTNEDMNMWSKNKSSFAKTSSKLPLAQYDVKIATDPLSTEHPINVAMFSWWT